MGAEILTNKGVAECGVAPLQIVSARRSAVFEMVETMTSDLATVRFPQFARGLGGCSTMTEMLESNMPTGIPGGRRSWSI